MELIEGLYLVTTTVLAGASVTLLAFAVSAYRSSGRTAMAYLAVGFGLVVLAAVATPVAAFRTAFANPQRYCSSTPGCWRRRWRWSPGASRCTSPARRSS